MRYRCLESSESKNRNSRGPACSWREYCYWDALMLLKRVFPLTIRMHQPFCPQPLFRGSPGTITPSAPPVEPARQGVLTLDRAIEEALRASPELEQIRERLDASEQQVRQAEASFYPV
jgi:hypothetical protein